MAKYIDLHSHIAWGIDDGMPSIEDAVSSLESAKKDGIVGICSCLLYTSPSPRD